MSALERSTSSTWLLSSACRSSPRRSASFSREPNLQACAREGGTKHEDRRKWTISAEEATLCQGYLRFRLSSLEAILGDETVGLGQSLGLGLQQILQSVLLRLENTRAEKHRGLKPNRAPFIKDFKCSLTALSPSLTVNVDSFCS